VSGSCVFGVKDLPNIARAPQLIAHKLYLDFEPAAYYCLAWAHHQRRHEVQVGLFTMAKTNRASAWLSQVENYAQLNEKYYKQLPSVRFHNLPADKKANFDCSV